MVHGDDFAAVGEEEKLAETRKVLEEKYNIKVEVLGGDKDDAKEVKILNKVVRRTENGIEMEADPRHVELIVRELELEKAKASKSPGSKAVKSKSDSDKSSGQNVAILSRPPKDRERIVTKDEETDEKKKDEEEEELGASEAKTC